MNSPETTFYCSSFVCSKVSLKETVRWDFPSMPAFSPPGADSGGDLQPSRPLFCLLEGLLNALALHRISGAIHNSIPSIAQAQAPDIQELKKGDQYFLKNTATVGGPAIP